MDQLPPLPIPLPIPTLNLGITPAVTHSRTRHLTVEPGGTCRPLSSLLNSAHLWIEADETKYTSLAELATVFGESPNVAFGKDRRFAYVSGIFNRWKKVTREGITTLKHSNGDGKEHYLISQADIRRFIQWLKDELIAGDYLLIET